MNIYSLEYFEQTLPVEKIRPPYRKPSADGPRLSVCDVEQSRGTVLPFPRRMEWCCYGRAPRVARDARHGDFPATARMQTQGGCRCAGVLLDTDAVDPAEFSVWRRAFDGAVLIARADQTEQIAALRIAGLPFGLLLDARAGILPVRRQLAEQGLQFVWQSAPVFILAKRMPRRGRGAETGNGWLACAGRGRSRRGSRHTFGAQGHLPESAVLRRGAPSAPLAAECGQYARLHGFANAAAPKNTGGMSPDIGAACAARLAGGRYGAQRNHAASGVPGLLELQCRVWKEKRLRHYSARQ